MRTRTSHGSVTFNIDKLDKGVKELKQGYRTRVGIIGQSATRQQISEGNEGLTNAQIGATHEFGSVAQKIPQRSFLRAPLHKKKAQIQKAGKKVIEIFKGKPIVDAYKALGSEALNIIDGAFTSRGYGEWPQTKDRTIESKASRLSGKKQREFKGMSQKEKRRAFQPLIDSGQLRKSIDYEVKGK